MVLALTASSALSQSAPQSFVSIVPCRLVDTRFSQGGVTMDRGDTQTFAIAGVCGVPPDAGAYSLNVTVVPHAPLNFLTIWPAGLTRPNVSTLNDASGEILANAAIVPAGSGGAISAFVTGATDIILDINGYFTSQTGPHANNARLSAGAMTTNGLSRKSAVQFVALGRHASAQQDTTAGRADQLTALARELQKQRRANEMQRSRIGLLEARLAALEAHIHERSDKTVASSGATTATTATTTTTATAQSSPGRKP
jgi:hypothetical protein